MAKHRKQIDVGRHGRVSKHGGGAGSPKYRHSANKPWQQRTTDFYLEATDKLYHSCEKALGFIVDKYVLAKDKAEELLGRDNRAEGRHSSPEQKDSLFTRAADRIDILLDISGTKLKDLLPRKAEKFGDAPKSERFGVPKKSEKTIQQGKLEAKEKPSEKPADVPKRAVFIEEEPSPKKPVKPVSVVKEEPVKKKQNFSVSEKSASVRNKSLFQGKGENKPKKKQDKKQYSPDELPSVSQLEAELKWEKTRKNKNVMLRNSVFALVAVAAAAVLVATLFLPVLQIYGSSMTPTLSEGNIVLSLKGSEFQQGDIISFYYNNKILVKRVIAFEGDWVNIDDDGNVYVNNKLIDEPYIRKKALGECDIKLPYQVPSGRIFVCGDHRETSVDSRSTTLGCVSEEQIVGKIVFRVWPVSKMGSIS